MDGIVVETKRIYDIGGPYMRGSTTPVLRIWERNDIITEVQLCGCAAPLAKVGAIRAALNQATVAGLIPNP